MNTTVAGSSDRPCDLDLLRRAATTIATASLGDGAEPALQAAETAADPAQAYVALLIDILGAEDAILALNLVSQRLATVDAEPDPDEQGRTGDVAALLTYAQQVGMAGALEEELAWVTQRAMFADGVQDRFGPALNAAACADDPEAAYAQVLLDIRGPQGARAVIDDYEAEVAAEAAADLAVHEAVGKTPA